MTISEVAEKMNLSASTLRYYEKVGLIPKVQRKNGIRHYQTKDLEWLDFIKCMRQAGLSLESLVTYTTLFQQGAPTKKARKLLLMKERDVLLEKYEALGDSLAHLNHKISLYED